MNSMPILGKKNPFEPTIQRHFLIFWCFAKPHKTLHCNLLSRYLAMVPVVRASRIFFTGRFITFFDAETIVSGFLAKISGSNKVDRLTKSFILTFLFKRLQSKAHK
jgi:hypothetical protein